MQEDKLSKQIADSLKKYQEKGNQPYELGAWESFEKMRGASKIKPFFWWIGGVAASLLLIATFYFLLPNSELESPLLAEDSQGTEKVVEENRIEEVSEEGSKITPSVKAEREAPGIQEVIPQGKSKNTKQPNGLSEKQSNQSLITSKDPAKQPIKEEEESKELISDLKSKESQVTQKVIAQAENIEEIKSESQSEISTTSGLISKESLMSESKVEQDKPLLALKAEPEFEAIPKEKSSLSYGLGVAPGFGSARQNGESISGNTLAMGVMVNLDLPGKLTLGSGLGLNLLNQQSDVSNRPTVGLAMNIAPSTETIIVRQTQVEIPIYLKYPITRSNSLSVQAGFSNFYAFNQQAELETSFTRQVTVADASAVNSFRTLNEDVVQTRTLESVDSRFYPLATMNFGLNIRLLQAEKSSYVLMPFYNYPLRQFTGFGDNPGFFGASFKVNFGGGKE